MMIVISKCILSYDVASWSEITPCYKIDKYVIKCGLLIYGKRYDFHNNVGYITKVYRFLRQK